MMALLQSITVVVVYTILLIVLIGASLAPFLGMNKEE